MSERRARQFGARSWVRLLLATVTVLLVCFFGRSARAGTLAISPASVTLPPSGTQTFTASGGSGTGYVWSLPVAPSGGTISASGLYTAGTTPNVLDQVQVTDSNFAIATAIVNVGPGVTITPSSVTLAPGDTQPFTASGGNAPYTWHLIGAGSGASASVSASGVYTAGANTGVDTVQVTDSLGGKDAVTITVVASVPLGTPCTTPGTCPANSSGVKNCVDGVCCDSACAGQCQACNTSSQVGTCVTISGPPVGKRTACPMGESSNPCSMKVCDGTSPTACTSFVGSDVTCGVASCIDGVGTPGAVCEGDGGCKLVVAKSCGAYACVSNACATACTDTSECSPGSYCNVATHKCVKPDAALASESADAAAGPASTPKVTTGCDVSWGAPGGGSLVALAGLVGALGLARRRRAA